MQGRYRKAKKECKAKKTKTGEIMQAKRKTILTNQNNKEK